jgi:hypothetical protein
LTQKEKNKMPARTSDPPIIVTGGGGGGGDQTPSKKPAKNVITIDCQPESPMGPRKFRTKINGHAEITSMLLEFPGMLGQEPITISGYDVYNVKITFNTDEGPKPPTAQKKKKKTPAKRPAARKKSK